MSNCLVDVGRKKDVKDMQGEKASRFESKTLVSSG